jgi:dTDP-glucose 4,6-dehydratase
MPSKKRVLITGGAGFIGSHTVDNFLKKGFNVRVIDNLIGGNLKNIEHLKNNSDFQFEKKDILKVTQDQIKSYFN